MIKLYLKLLIAFLCTATGLSTATAQNVRVEIVVQNVYVNYTGDGDDSYGGRFRFYLNTPEDRCGPMLHSDCNSRDNRCIRTPVGQKEYWGNIGHELKNFDIPLSNTVFTLYMRTHHERQKDCTSKDSYECTVENLGCGHPDRHEFTTSIPVNLASYPPGVFVPLGTMVNDDGGSYASADLMIRYSIPTPVAPSPVPGGSVFCANDIVELATDVLPNNTGLQYQWQYALKSEDYEIWNPNKDPRNWIHPTYGCGHYEVDPAYPEGGEYWYGGNDCHLPDYVIEHVWRTLTITNSNTERIARFTPLQALFNNNITAKSDVYFQVKTSSADGLNSQYSLASIYSFLPPPPALDINQFTIKRSCPNPNNGRITIPYNAISTPFPQVRWLLKPGYYNSGTCEVKYNPDGTISSPCGEIENQSNGLVNVPKTGSDAPIIIDNVSKGEYSLWVINPGETSGLCYTPVNIKIDSFYSPTLTKISSNNISCAGASDGSFIAEGGGGDASDGYRFKLVARNHPELNTGFVAITGNRFERTGLPADTYDITMQNVCTPQIVPQEITITLTEPVRTVATAESTQPTCYSPANGIIVIDVLKGMGQYAYRIKKDSEPTKDTANTGTHMVFERLLPGRYSISVLDANRLTCAGWDTTIVLAAPPVIGSAVRKVDSVSCYGGSDGRIEVVGSGAAGNYVFTLKNAGGATVDNNTTGVFNNLPYGTYTLVTSRPANESCNDTSMRSILVPQRSLLRVNLIVDSVTCNGQQDGRARARATGGSGEYDYFWEYWNGSAWYHDPFWFSSDTMITLLDPGNYRVTVSDKRSTADCKVVSAVAALGEPGVLAITRVEATDAACKDDGARIRITPAGGNGGYLYYYSIGDRLHYVQFTANTPLDTPGNYYVKVTDAKGCSVESTTSYAVGLPAAQLDFLLDTSNYEGWAVSCYNGSNGRITVTASGGSGSGYEYRIGTGAWQSSPVFEQLAAGTYNIIVKDTRGCEITKSITITQPGVPVQGTITDKKEVDCPGTATGAFRILAQNGRPPYQYSIDNGANFQSGNYFTGLPTGTYRVVIKDKYDCSYTTDVTLVSIVPVMQFTHAITDVSCHNGNNGAVTVTSTGGAPPYQFAWENSTNTTNQHTGLRAGNYMLHITDAAGCFHHDTVVIRQPAAPLTAVVQTHPVCVGSLGTITVLANGGTAPYRYSADNGSNFQDNAVFASLHAGSYPVVIKDRNNCTAAYTAVINPANAMPDINFLVASGKNALDTLVIREVSIPAPDSVYWRFDPAAQVMETDTAAPRIKFNLPGSYWVEMTGYFKGCAYTLRKTIQIKPYDPDAGLVYTPPVRIIDTVLLYPNPNDGQFAVQVKMNRKQKLVMMVQDMGTGREVVRRSYDPALATEDRFTLGNIAPGTFVLRVITENDSRDVLFVINR